MGLERKPSVLNIVIKIFMAQFFLLKLSNVGCPGGSVAKNPPTKAGDTDSIPGLGGSHMPWSS